MNAGLVANAEADETATAGGSESDGLQTPGPFVDITAQADGRWWFVCHTCATHPDSEKHTGADGFYGHEALTRNYTFAHLCLREHGSAGHEAEVLRVE